MLYPFVSQKLVSYHSLNENFISFARLHGFLKMWFWVNSVIFPSAVLASSKAEVCVASFELMLPSGSGYGESSFGF